MAMGRPQKHTISVGARHRHLTVTADAGYNKYQCRMFMCRCDCGEVVKMRATHFYPSRRYCSRKCRLLSDVRVIDRSGERFGRWVVLSFASTDDRNDAMWNCVCDCGTERVVRGVMLASGDSQSCGCLMIDTVTKYETVEDKLEARRKNARTYNHRNAAKVKAIGIRYRNKLSHATPKWLTPEHWAAMNAIYEEARRRTRESGIRHDVDHIHPINGKTLSGLHVPWNLQILTQAANVSKSNRYAEHSGD